VNPRRRWRKSPSWPARSTQSPVCRSSDDTGSTVTWSPGRSVGHMLFPCTRSRRGPDQSPPNISTQADSLLILLHYTRFREDFHLGASSGQGAFAPWGRGVVSEISSHWKMQFARSKSSVQTVKVRLESPLRDRVHGKKPGCPGLWPGRNGRPGVWGRQPPRLFPWKKPRPVAGVLHCFSHRARRERRCPEVQTHLGVTLISPRPRSLFRSMISSAYASMWVMATEQGWGRSGC
jgi:hypothetical protein